MSQYCVSMKGEGSQGLVEFGWIDGGVFEALGRLFFFLKT
jgi:hypothetical protein